MITLRQLEKEIHRLDPSLFKGDSSWNAALTLMASLYTGPNIKKISKFTHIPRATIAEMSKRLRENEVWVGNKIDVHEWIGKNGGIAFWCDVLVALGMLQRVK